MEAVLRRDRCAGGHRHCHQRHQIDRKLLCHKERDGCCSQYEQNQNFNIHGAGSGERIDFLPRNADGQVIYVVQANDTLWGIAAVHGHALAGGAGLATACDLVLAREDAVFGYPEVHLGFVPAMVMALLRRAVGEKVAFELVVRGERIGAGEALGLGLVNRVIPAAEWDDAVTAYASEIAKLSRTAVPLIKRLLYGMDGMAFEDAIARGAEVNVLARMTPDTRAGVRRFLDRKKGK